MKYENGWLIFFKKNSFPEGLRNLEDVYEEIQYKFQYEIADSIAFHNARAVFDSTRYYSQCFKYSSLGELFKTSYHETDEDYAIMGDITDNVNDLLRLWKNEKYSSVVKLDDGYAVVYQLQKRSARQLTYENALPKIEEVFAAKNRLKTAKEYLSTLRAEICEGADADSSFFFLGGWQRAEDLDLDSNIFGSEYSSLILQDIVGKEVKYCSPVLTLAENTLFFYRIDRLNMVSYSLFESHKAEFKEEVEQERFRNWLKIFRAKLRINVNI